MLTEQFSRCRTPHASWQTKTQEEKAALFSAFWTFVPKVKKVRTVTSSDGVLTMPTTPQIARKPGQRKRPRAERARTNN